ncbi:MAG TPA: aminoglycoside phosphotransferase family protein, partial [Feifaniaceae bacterium]|nr:aminoglycoside phosphotransferase family protein [Feifaniaceae bacterium]
MGGMNGWKRIAEGNTSEIFDIGPDRILKLFKDGIPFTACAREFENTSAARELLQNVPEPLKLTEVETRCGIVYEKIAGTNMLEEMLSHIRTIRKQSRRLAQYHADIQKSVTGKLETVKEKLQRDILAADLLDTEEKNKVLAYMGTLPDDIILCHFDFHPGNILIRGDEPVVIDWMTACMGDKGADAARTGIMLKYGEVPRSSR